MSEFFDHSLPALKFCSKIRQCIFKNLLKIKDKRRLKGVSKPTVQSEISKEEDTLHTQISVNEDFMNKINGMVTTTRRDILSSKYQSSETYEVYSENDDFIDWYKSKMKDITYLMDLLVKESKVNQNDKALNSFIQNKSEECIMLKHELDKLRNHHDDMFQQHTHYEVSYPLRRSSESMGSAKYFSTNTEYNSKDPKNKHQNGVLKRPNQMSSTPSFKPGENFSQYPKAHIEAPPRDDTIGNKFDELEKRLISLENTLDSKPEVLQDNYNSLKSFNPFSPDRNEVVYVADQEQLRNSIEPYNSYSNTDTFHHRSKSNEYIDTSAEQDSPQKSHDRSTSKAQSYNEQPGVQNLINKIKHLEQILDQNNIKFDEYEAQLESQTHKIYELQSKLNEADETNQNLQDKLDNEIKMNERLTITYDVLREDKIKDYLKSKEEAEQLNEKFKEYQDQIDSLNETIDKLNDNILDHKAEISGLNQTIKSQQHEIDRLNIDKEAIARIADTTPLTSKIAELENKLKHAQGLIENEKHTRQQLSDNMIKRDRELEELERINYDIKSDFDRQDQITHVKQLEIEKLQYHISELEANNNDLNNELKDQTDRILELESDLAQCGKCYQDLEKEMSILKAKEFDRLGVQRKIQEYEAQLKQLEYENSVLNTQMEK